MPWKLGAAAAPSPRARSAGKAVAGVCSAESERDDAATDEKSDATDVLTCAAKSCEHRRPRREQAGRAPREQVRHTYMFEK